MSSGWSWFVIIGTVASLVAMLWLLFANRKTSGNETTGHEWDGIEELDSPLPLWWVWLFVGTILFTVVYLVIFPGLGNVEGATGWSSQKEHDTQVQAHRARFDPLYAELGSLSLEDLSADRRAQQIGRRIYLNNCSTCHGISAQGSFGFPNLADEEWIWGGSFDAIKHSIRHGRTAQMPGWGPALGDQGVVEVSHYVRQLAGLEHDAVLAANGLPRYQQICVACHGGDGTGNAALGAPDLTNDIWLYGSSLEEIGFTVREGRTGIMPNHQAILDENRIHIVSGYVIGLSQ